MNKLNNVKITFINNVSWPTKAYKPVSAIVYKYHV